MSNDYEYTGTIDEVKSNVNNKDKFHTDAVAYARKAIGDEIMRRLDPITIDVNEKIGTFKILFVDQESPDEHLLRIFDSQRHKERSNGSNAKQERTGA